MNEYSYSPLNEFDQTLVAIDSTIKNYSKIESNLKNFNCVLGFDGYLDLLYQMVKNRYSTTKVEFYASMKEFGQRIVDTAGSSTSIERVLKKELGGGFSVNTGRVIANMIPNAKIEVIATMGYPSICPIFPKTLPKNVSLHTIGNMGITFAMEFNDGKVMSQDMEGILSINWNLIVERIGGYDQLYSFLNNAKVIGLGQWAILPQMSDYWEHLLKEYLPNITQLKKKFFFVDPADLKKRSKQEIRNMLKLLSQINEYIPVILSLNDREAMDISHVLIEEGVPIIQQNQHQTYKSVGIDMNKILNLDYLIIHDPHFATISGLNYHSWITEGYTSKPLFQTGAGDHFNGGIIVALEAGFNPSEALIIANIATAIFVRTGESPSISQIFKFLKKYLYYIINDDNSIIF